MQHDLTDTWHGRFAFPHSYEPISFLARIQQVGQWLSGQIEEPGMRNVAEGKLLSATISGKVTADTVVFLKTYDEEVPGYDAVRYDGRVGDHGLEIAGTWTIPGNWSGTFLMIRARGLVIEQSVYEEERL